MREFVLSYGGHWEDLKVRAVALSRWLGATL